MLSQEQYLALQKPIRNLDIKIELLNQNDMVIDTLEGYALSGNINLQADSTYRRSGSLKMVIHNNNLIPKSDSKIWFNRKIRIHIGLRDWNDEIIWFNQGIFVIQDAQLDKSQSEKTIDLQITDLMGLLDGTLNGNITHEIQIVPEGVTIAEALRATLSSLGKVSIDSLRVNDIDMTVPYEITAKPNGTVYDLATELINLYMDIEFYFDENGYLIIRRIRDRKQDPVLWDFSKDSMNLAINNSRKLHFSNVRNSIQVWGKKHDDGRTIKWRYRNRYARNTIAERNAISNMEIGDICHVINEGVSYVWNSEWEELGFTLPVEYNIENIGEKIFSFTDEKIFTDEQAMLRAEFELKQRSNLAETISCSCVPVYGLTPNSKIRVHEPDIGIEGDYLVKSVSVPLRYDGTMTFDAEKIYY